MSDQTSDAPAPVTRAGRRSSRAPRTDWREGGRTVLRWREWMLAAALIAAGLGVLAGALLATLQPAGWAGVAALVPLLPLLACVIWALTVSRPAGLLRFRALDVLYGLVLGAVLRVVQGWLELAAGDAGTLPSYVLVGGRLADGWWLTDLIAPVAIAPLVEEFFFRGVVLVALYTVLRKPFGVVAAGIAAVAVSVGAFVLVHGLAGSLGTDDAIAVALLGLVCALLVMLTGRIWGAVLVHVVYNASFVVLALGGTFWGA